MDGHRRDLSLRRAPLAMSDETSAAVEGPRREDASDREGVGAGTKVEGASAGGRGD